MECRGNPGGSHPSGIRRTWAEPTGGRFHADLVRADLVFGIVPADECKAVETGTERNVEQLSGKLADVIRDMVMEKKTWRELAYKYDVSETMIAKYRKKAISELTAIYQLREQTAGEYFLS